MKQATPLIAIAIIFLIFGILGTLKYYKLAFRYPLEIKQLSIIKLLISVIASLVSLAVITYYIALIIMKIEC